jgi:N-methylhydantoinase A
MPGPACYGRGGREPTVTDANLVLGLLDADHFLGGEMRLDKDAAERAIGALAETLDLTIVETARGIFRIVTETMASSARTHSADRGVDYRNLPLFAFGGAGAIHACAVAELLNSTMVIVPPKSSVLSAVGTLVTPARLDLMRSHIVRVDELDWNKVRAVFRQMRAEAIAALGRASGGNADIEFRYEADLRYQGQQYEVTVALDFDPETGGDTARLNELFEQTYRTLYGLNPSNVAVEAVTWRLSARTRLDGATIDETLPGNPGRPRARRALHAWGDRVDAVVFDRSVLAQDQIVEGPAVIEERETTTIVPPDWSAKVDGLGCIVLKGA